MRDHIEDLCHVRITADPRKANELPFNVRRDVVTAHAKHLLGFRDGPSPRPIPTNKPIKLVQLSGLDRAVFLEGSFGKRIAVRRRAVLHPEIFTRKLGIAGPIWGAGWAEITNHANCKTLESRMI